MLFFFWLIAEINQKFDNLKYIIKRKQKIKLRIKTTERNLEVLEK